MELLLLLRELYMHNERLIVLEHSGVGGKGRKD
jgi:hypothetical protein